MNGQLKALVAADDQRVGDVEAQLQKQLPELLQCEQRAAALQTMVTKMEDANKVLSQEGQRDSKQESKLDNQVEVLRKQYGEAETQLATYETSVQAEEALREKAEAQTAAAAKLRDEVEDLRDEASKSAAAAAAMNVSLAKSEVSAAHAREAETLATRRAGEIGEELFALRGKYKAAQDDLRKAEDAKTAEEQAEKEGAEKVPGPSAVQPAPAAGLLSRQRRHLHHAHAAHAHARKHLLVRSAATRHALPAAKAPAPKPVAAPTHVSAPAVEAPKPVAAPVPKKSPAPARAWPRLPALDAPTAPAVPAAPAAPVAPASVPTPAAAPAAVQAVQA